MMGQMLGPEGLYLLAKELRPKPRARPGSVAVGGSPLRVRIGRGLIAAGTAIGGERLTPASGPRAARMRDRATSPTA